MEFINNFICFEEQQVELPDDFNDVIEIISPFVRFISVGINATVKGLECIKDKSYMVFIVNDGLNPITFNNEDLSVNNDQQIRVSVQANKILTPSVYDVFVYTGNKWLVGDVQAVIANALKP